MNKAQKLRLCNYALLIFTILTLASSIQIEATDSSGIMPVWLHVITAAIFTVLVFYHIFLHFHLSNWFAKFPRLKSRVIDVLGSYSLLLS